MNVDARSANLLIARGAKCDARDDRGDTPLKKAVGRSDVALMNLLLDRGANIDAPDKGGETPLMFACIWYGVPREKTNTALLNHLDWPGLLRNVEK